MAEKIISPGVFTKEIDETFLPAAIGDIGAAVVGPTVKGPVLVPTTVSSYAEFQNLFGDTFKSGSDYYTYLTSQTAEQYLKDGNRLTVVRVAGDGYSKATSDVPNRTGQKLILDFAAPGTPNATGPNGPIIYVTGPVGNAATSTTIGFKITGSRSGIDQGGHAAVNAITGSTANEIAKNFAASASMKFNPNITGSSDTSDAFTTLGKRNFSGVKVELASDIVTLTTVSSSKFYNDLSSSFGEISADSADSASITTRWGTLEDTGTAFTLNTKVAGEIFNNRPPSSILSSYDDFTGSFSLAGNKNILTSGSEDNLRYEVSNVNVKKGTFTLLIRKGTDIDNRKEIFETWNDLSLDPNANNYIAKRIGNQYYDIAGTTAEPYIQAYGEYPVKSKFVYVSNVTDTPNYLDENGNIRLNAASASLPALGSGSFHGAFNGGSNGAIQHPQKFSENININSQGLYLHASTTDTGSASYEKAINLLANQDEYDINLLFLPGIISGEGTSNSYHSSIAAKAIDMCESRGDCFTVIDPVAHGSSVTDAKTEAETRDSSYAAMYWPWVKLANNRLGKMSWVPPSVATAGVYTFNDKVSEEWFAPAGLNRGTITTAQSAERVLLQKDRDDLYDSSVNPVATFPGQGVCLFGQKTLQRKASALDRVNVRRLLIRLKKFIASTSRFLVFEQNNTKTRKRFLSIVNPFLEDVRVGSGLNEFKVVMDSSNNTPDIVDRNILYGQIFVQPTRTAEFIVLDFTVQPTGASFPE